MHDKRTEIAWAAGLFEGEGCWQIRRRDGKVASVVATLASTDADVVEKFAAIIGFGTIRVVQPANPNAKTQYWWSGSKRSDVKEMAAAFLPHMGERRRARAVEILAAPDARPDRKVNTHCPQGHPYDDANTYWYVKDGYSTRLCRTCRAARNTPEDQRRRRKARKLRALEAHN